MKNYKLSIIVPVYNGERTLPRLIKEFNKQYDPASHSVQVFFIDDGSSDGTKDILASLTAPFYSYSISHQGTSGARNYGISIASGEYIAFCDQDDDISKYYFKKIFATLKDNYDFYVFSKEYNFVGRDKNVDYIFDTEVLNKNTAVEKLFSSNPPQLFATVWNCVYKTSIVKRNNVAFDTQLKHGSEDTAFNIDYLSHVETVLTSSDKLYRYNIYESGNTIQKENDDAIEDFGVLKEHLKRLHTDKNAERFFNFRLLMHSYVKATKGKRIKINRRQELVESLLALDNTDDVLNFRVRFNNGNNVFYGLLRILLGFKNKFSNLIAFELFRCLYIRFSSTGL